MTESRISSCPEGLGCACLWSSAQASSLEQAVWMGEVSSLNRAANSQPTGHGKLGLHVQDPTSPLVGGHNPMNSC